MHDQPTTERAVAVAEDDPLFVTTDHACIDCGYNLRTLAHTGNCPECGTPVADSLRGDQLIYANAKWLKWHHYGWRLLAIGFLLSLTCRPVMQWISMLQLIGSANSWIAQLINQIGGFLYSACLIVTAFILTMREPRLRDQPRSRWFTTIRLSAAATGVLLISRFAASRFGLVMGNPNSNPGSFLLNLGITITIPVAIGLTIVGCAILLNQTARRISNRRLMRQSKLIIIGTIITSGLAILAYTTWGGLRLASMQFSYITSLLFTLYRNADIFVDIYAFAAVAAICVLLKQVRLQQKLIACGDGQEAISPVTGTNNNLIHLNNRYVSRNRKGLALLKWAAILTPCLFNMAVANSIFMTVLNILSWLVVIVFLFVGCLFVLRRPPKSSVLHRRIPLTFELVWISTGLAAIGIICLIFGLMRQFTWSHEVSPFIMIFIVACMIIALFGVLYHLLWLANVIGQPTLAIQFKWFTISAGIYTAILGVIMLAGIFKPDDFQYIFQYIVIGIFFTAYLLSLWLVTLIDQLWRHFDRPKLIMASDQ